MADSLENAPLRPTVRDLVIVGAGPAGLSASIYAARSLLDALTLEQEAVGGQVILTSEIDNYPGVPQADGYSLVDTMRRQAEDLGASIEMLSVERIDHDPQTGLFTLTTSEGALLARSVIVAGGATPRYAGFDGEERFGGHGVSYCATCDGMFYRGKDVYVIGGGNSAAEEALFLTRFAKKVIMVVRKDHLRAQASVARQIEENDKIEVLYQTEVVRVDGDGLLTSITLKDVKTGQKRTEERPEGSFGVFVFVGRVPASQLLGDLVDLDAQGYVIADQTMATKTAGLFVAGDVREKPLRQIVTAVSDGAIAATSAAAYLGQPVFG